MKICLIIPPSEFLVDERVFMPLGILRVATVLKISHKDVNVLDLSNTPNYIEVLENVKHDYTHYGITATTAQIPATIQIQKVLRKIAPTAKVILGGAHGTTVYASSKRGNERSEKLLNELTQMFDVIVVGDGESAIFEALSDTPPSIIDADRSDSSHFIRDQETLPFPMRDFIDEKSYFYSIDGVPATSIVSQLGCPFSCAFCCGRSSPFYRRIRNRSVKLVIEEIDYMYKRCGYTGFMFLDDELNVSPLMNEFMKGLIEYQKSIGETLSLRGFIKSELFDEEQAELMKLAGFKELLVGFESGNNRILSNIRKVSTVDDNTRCMEIAHTFGLKTKALMSIGHPGESVQTILDTQAWLVSVRPTDFDITIITPYPGSPYFDNAIPSQYGWTYTAKSGDRLHMIDADYTKDTHYYKGIPGQYVSFVYTDYLNQKEIVEHRDAIESSVRRLLKIPYPIKHNYEHSMGQTKYEYHKTHR